MIIGVPKEIRKDEYRVGLTPYGAYEYIQHGHNVIVEKNAGIGSCFSDDDYRMVGCQIESKKKKIFDKADMIIKVKEPQVSEYDLFHEGQILYAYLHLAANKKLTEEMAKRKIIGIAYETVTSDDGSLPLLMPMSQIAGRLAIQEGAKYLEKSFGGRGILLGGIPGIKKGNVLIIGCGTAGKNACKIAVGMGANVTVMDISTKKLAKMDDIFGSSISSIYSNRYHILEAIRDADLIIGTILIPGARTPKVIKREDLQLMKSGTVLVDISIDQGGCFETSKVTYHSDPTYIIDGIVHYCVDNMPGSVSLTSTNAITSVTTPYGLVIANMGIEKAIKENGHIRNGVNLYKGKITNKPVAEAHNLTYEPCI